MTADGRGYAWTMAASLLDWVNAARRHIADTKGYDPDTPLPPIYHAVLAEAAIYAELAKADIQVGLAGGDWLEHKVEAEREAEELREKRESLFEEMTKPSGDA